ncbi:MAG: glycosyltransferase family 4 protein, partial [Anaerolineales bacterium]|nr:glycosyltransferase family 4 protein [Anaerolineales bacterium]
MMRIGLVTGEYPPMEGGVGAFTRELARALADLGHEIHVLTSREARPKTADRRLRDLSTPLDEGFARVHPFIRKWRWPAVAQVADLVTRYDLDVVNVQYQAAAYDMRSPAVNLLPWRLRGLATCVVTFHDLRVPYLFPKAGRLRETAVFHMARQANAAIVTNQADFQTLARFQGDDWQLRQIPIGSNITTYTPHAIELAEARALSGAPPGGCLLGYFGFLNDSKGADTLVHALARLDDATRLVFIGGQTGSSDPTNRAFLAGLQAEIAALGVSGRVHWTVFLADQGVSTFLHAADVMVMPYRDGVSLRRGTLMAALAHGRPLITTQPAA